MIRALLFTLLNAAAEWLEHHMPDLGNDDAFDAHADEAIAITAEPCTEPCEPAPDLWCERELCAECLLSGRTTFKPSSRRIR